MNVDLNNLPDDASLPKQVVLDLLLQYEEKIHYLEEQVRLFKNELFGRTSEKRSFPNPYQLPIVDVADDPTTDERQPANDGVVIEAHRRRKRGRKPLPKELPRIDIIHDLDEDKKQCACGTQLSRIGEEVSEKLDYIPARLRVERHIRYKYACKNCEGVDDDGPTVRIAPVPVQLIPKSNATAGLLSHIAVAKFADAVPLYRQQKIFNRLSIDLSRAVMAKWMVQSARQCHGLIDLLENEIRGGPLINIDETPLQVLNETGRSNTAKSYMWVYRGGAPGRPVLLYHYYPTRSGRIALRFIDDYNGYIQTDDYAGYNHLGEKPGIVHMGCWAHGRRKFVKVVQVRKSIVPNGPTPRVWPMRLLGTLANCIKSKKNIKK